MKRYVVAPLVLAAATVVWPGVAHADPIPPGLQTPCPAELVGTMTLLPDEQTYVICQEGAAGYAWTAAPVPFEPKFKLPGLDLARSINSRSVLAGKPGFTSSILVPMATMLTGVNDLTGS